MSSPTFSSIPPPPPPPPPPPSSSESNMIITNNGGDHVNNLNNVPTPTSSSCPIPKTSPSRRSRTNININNNAINGDVKSLLLTNSTVEDDVLDQITKESEARLAARRQARAEAREIRLREVERNQKLLEESSDINGGIGGTRNYDSLLNHHHHQHLASSGTPVSNHMDHIAIRSRATPLVSRESRTSSYASSRRSSQESLDLCVDSPREIRNYLNELEDKFRKAMINNAQLDNEKQSFIYQIDSYKDEMEELEENYLRLQRDFKEKSRNYEQLKRDNERLQFDFKCYKNALDERERLIREAGLVIIRNNGGCNAKLMNKDKLLKGVGGMMNGNGQHSKMVNGSGPGDNDGEENDGDAEQEDDLPIFLANNISLISKDAALMLEDIHGSTLEAKLSSMMSERISLQQTIKDLKSDLEDERNRLNSLNDSLANNSLNLTSEMQAEIQREANKMTNDLRYKLKKGAQENAALTSTVSRLETQVIRLKSSVDEAERVEEELKLDKRKAQRELREALTKIEELESANAHLQKRIDKLKTNRNLLGMITNSNSTGSNPNTPLADVVPNSVLIPLHNNHQPSQSPPPSSSASDVSTLCSTTTTSTSDE